LLISNRKGIYPDRYFTLRSTYLQGLPPKRINMYWRRFAVADIPLADQDSFDAWLLARWREKDDLLESYFDSGRFPSDLAGTVTVDGAAPDPDSPAAHGYVEADIRLGHAFESLQIFAVLGVVALVLRYFGLC
jgi:hypothetical protein